MITYAVLGAVGLLVAVWLTDWFVRLERANKSGAIVVAILTFTIIDSCFWANPDDVPNGLFHPGGAFRLPELLIVCALIARWIARGAPRRLGDTALWMTLWCVWVAAAAVVGIMSHHDTTEVLYESKAIVYVGGGFALAGGVPVEQYFNRRGLLSLIVPFGIAAAVLGVMTKSGLLLALSIPTLEMPTLGVLGADTASLFVALGLFALVMAATQRRRSRAYVIAAVPLLLSAVVAEQRAALVALAVSSLILIVAAILPPSRHRFWTTPTDIAVVVAIGVALVTMIIVIPVATSSSASPTIPLVSDATTRFGQAGKRQSADQRVNQIDAAIPAIEERPIMGWGLAKPIRFFVTGENKTDDSPITHNIALDLLLRMGAVGFLLFVVTVGLLVRDGIRTWRRHPDNLVASFALVCMAIVVGLLAKGLVESIFEKYRLAVALGLFMGMVRAAATSPRPTERGVRRGMGTAPPR